MLKNSELGEKAVLKRSTRRLSEHLSNINQLKTEWKTLSANPKYFVSFS